MAKVRLPNLTAMVPRPRAAGWLCATIALCTFAAGAHAAINLSLQPPAQTVQVGDEFTVRLMAMSDTAAPQTLSALAAIIDWDESRLELRGLNRSDEGYPWLNSFFPNDESLDRLNNDCGINLFCDPYTFRPMNDGLAYYEAWSAFPPQSPAAATNSGLLVTRFRFRAIRAGTSRIAFQPAAGEFTRTRVMHGSIPGLEATGAIGPPTQVDVTSCAVPPDVQVEGSRYLAITPRATTNLVALFVAGSADDEAVSCISGYLQTDGTLAETPFFQSAAAWSTQHLTGEFIRPNSTYTVQTDCGAGGIADLSAPVAHVTWIWGDVTGDNRVDTDDVIFVLDAASGVFSTATVQNMDMAPCAPNGSIDTDDVLAVLDAVGGVPYACPQMCVPNYDLTDFALLRDCMRGPNVMVTVGCQNADYSNDHDVDLQDYAVFQVLFATTSPP